MKNIEMNFIPSHPENNSFEMINVNGVINFEDFRLQRLYNPTDSQSDRFFRCDLCLVWFFDIVDLFIHIEEQHEHIRITFELQDLLYNKWEQILNIKKVVLRLLSENHFKGAKRTLKSSLRSFGSITTGIFRRNDNIFEHYLSNLRSEMKLLIKENRSIHIGYSATNGSSKSKSRKRKYIDEIEKELRKRRNSSDFSSDDNICLKDTLGNITNGKKIKIINDYGSENGDEESSNLLSENKYYIIPERNDKDQLNYLEYNQVCTIINNFINDKEIGPIDSLKNVILRRFDYEMDEVIPEKAIPVSEWVFSKELYATWDIMSIHDFLYKKSQFNIKESVKNEI